MAANIPAPDASRAEGSSTRPGPGKDRTDLRQTLSGRGGGETTVRTPYQQRLDQLKVRIVELSHRNMESALRLMRSWMDDQ